MKYLSILALWLFTFPGAAVLHPVIVDPHIIGCYPRPQWPSDGPCSFQKMYGASGIVLRDYDPVIPPDPNGGKYLVYTGVTCRKGNALTGSRFEGCTFNTLDSYAPLMQNCELKDTTSWELTAQSKCNLVRSNWGPTNGAGPGGECVVVIQVGNAGNHNSAHTIMGILDPTVVANSGDRFCQKPLPPNVTCDVVLPDTIDHKSISPNQESSVSIDGSISCGSHPVVSILGGGRIDLAPGVITQISAHLLGEDRLQITSDLVATNGEVGQHSGSTVIIVSPY